MSNLDANAEDKAWRDYSQRFTKEVLPKLLSSETFISIGSNVTSDFDVRQATEIGAALLTGKPILLVIPEGRNVSPNLLRAADVVIRDWNPDLPAAQEQLMDAIEKLHNRFHTEELKRLTLADRQWADHVKRLSEESERLRAALEACEEDRDGLHRSLDIALGASRGGSV